MLQWQRSDVIIFYLHPHYSNMKPTYLTKIRTKRKKRKLTQAVMAERLCMNKLAYERLERGITILSVDRLIKIAEVLGVKVGELL
jgi:transcriptional regulator with XRE-family HTH domain